MPTLSAHHSTRLIKAINVGMSGSGKTAALASLAIAGYNLWVLDYDNGLDILVDLLRADPAALARVTYETFRDRQTILAGKIKYSPPLTAFKGAGRVLTEWKASEFTDKDVLVLETLTSFSEAGLNEAKSLGGRLNERPELQDWGWMAEAVRNFIQLLTDPGDSVRPPSLPCHVIVNTHIKFLEADEEATVRRSQSLKSKDAIELVRGVPNALGQDIPRTVGRFFNTVLLTSSSGSGPSARRIISTTPQGIIETKCAAPVSAKATYPQATGLAELFKDILGKEP